MVPITAFTVVPAWKVHTRGSTVTLHKAIQTLVDVCQTVKEQRKTETKVRHAFYNYTLCPFHMNIVTPLIKPNA